MLFTKLRNESKEWALGPQSADGTRGELLSDPQLQRVNTKARRNVTIGQSMPRERTTHSSPGERRTRSPDAKRKVRTNCLGSVNMSVTTTEKIEALKSAPSKKEKQRVATG